MRKKSILFIIESLTCAGAERSLVTLLTLIDYSKYEVSLQLFQYGGEFERFLPKEVVLLPRLNITAFMNLRLTGQLIYSFKKFKFRLLWHRVCYSYKIRRGHQSPVSISRLYWKCFARDIENSKHQYDIAIAYAQGIPTFYLADKIPSRQKLAWVNVSQNLGDTEKKFQKTFYNKVDKIVCVSTTAKTNLVQIFPEFKEKMYIIMDILSADTIRKAAQEEDPYKDCHDKKIIVTVARLSAGQKGMDITIEVIKILSKRKIDFRWYILGQGGYYSEMVKYIRKNNLTGKVELLGVKANPYPFIKNADIYVQTSRHEGFGLSIAEARILDKPVVTTEFDAVYAQMVPGENGLVVPQDPVAVADAVERLLSDADLYQHIVGYLKQEKKGNTEEIEKFYNLLQE